VSNIATGRMTIGALFGTISTTANAISGVVGTAAAGVGMLDSFVKKELKEQETRHFLEGLVFEENLSKELSLEQAQKDIVFDQFCDSSTRNAQLFNSHLTRLQDALASRKRA
jgi:hypothetical protein